MKFSEITREDIEAAVKRINVNKDDPKKQAIEILETYGKCVERIISNCTVDGKIDPKLIEDQITLDELLIIHTLTWHGVFISNTYRWYLRVGWFNKEKYIDELYDMCKPTSTYPEILLAPIIVEFIQYQSGIRVIIDAFDFVAHPGKVYEFNQMLWKNLLGCLTYPTNYIMDVINRRGDYH